MYLPLSASSPFDDPLSNGAPPVPFLRTATILAPHPVDVGRTPGLPALQRGLLSTCLTAPLGAGSLRFVVLIAYVAV